MKLLKRFAYYFGGFSMGLLILFFIWGGKETSCAYFPNARVLKEIRSKTISYAPPAQEFLEKQNIDTLAISKILHQGKVDFKASKASQKEPCRIYIVNGSHQKQQLQIEVEECKETNKLATILAARFQKDEE